MLVNRVEWQIVPTANDLKDLLFRELQHWVDAWEIQAPIYVRLGVVFPTELAARHSAEHNCRARSFDSLFLKPSQKRGAHEHRDAPRVGQSNKTHASLYQFEILKETIPE